jgi:hypothetical protein
MVAGEMRSLVVTLEASRTGTLGYVYFQEIRPGGAARTVELEPSSVFADYDNEGRLLGLEFLHAESATHALLVSLAERLGVPQLRGLDLAEMCKAAA